MSPVNLQKNSEFISLSEAVMLVTYSRDYLGRLAREGKIISKQIDKQWFVNRESLLYFFAHSALEDSVKKRILSLSRKNDLEVKENYRERVKAIKARSMFLPNASLAATVLIIAAGLFSGVLMQKTSAATPEGPVTFALLVKSLDVISAELPSQRAAVGATTLFREATVSETEEPISMENGIVIFPAGTQSSTTESVTELFSDKVTVVVTSTTTGEVRLSGGDVTLPFVRVPKESKP